MITPSFKEIMDVLVDICDKNHISLELHADCDNDTFTFYSSDCYKSSIVMCRHNWRGTLYDFINIVKDHFAFNHYTKNNFDWSYYMKKAFTKADLKNGDVIKRRHGAVQIICLETDTCICQTGGFNLLSDIKNDLTHKIWSESDIMEVRRPNQPHHCSFKAFDDKRGILVYERTEPVEMTLEEVCEALGKDIKIVKR